MAPSINLPILTTDCSWSDPYDEVFFLPQSGQAAHPRSTCFGPIANLPKNFGRTSYNDPASPWAGGIIGITFPENFTGLDSIMVHAHQKYGSVSELAKGWVPMPIYLNPGSPSGRTFNKAGIGAQDKGEFVYFGIDYEVFHVGSAGGTPLAHRTVLYRMNNINGAQVRYSFNTPPDNTGRTPAQIAKEIFVTDTDPPLLFFFDETSIWHALDDGETYLGKGHLTGGVEDTRIGQYGNTYWPIPTHEPYRPDQVHLPAGGTLAIQGAQIFRGWSAPTFWPELWLVTGQYAQGSTTGWNGGFDIYKVANTHAGSTDLPTEPGWPTDWNNHKLSTLQPLPGLDLTGDNPLNLTFRFFRDKHISNSLWVTCTGQLTSAAGDAYQNAWFARSADDGRHWGKWTRGPIARSYNHDSSGTAKHTTVGLQHGIITSRLIREFGVGGAITWTVPSSYPILSNSNEPLLPIYFLNKDGPSDLAQDIGYATLYAVTWKGAGGADKTPRTAIFRRGELNRETWL